MSLLITCVRFCLTLPVSCVCVCPVCVAALDAYVFLRDTKAFEADTHKVLARTVSTGAVIQVVFRLF